MLTATISGFSLLWKNRRDAMSYKSSFTGSQIDSNLAKAELLPAVAANLKLFGNAGGTAFETSTGMKTAWISRDMTTASGSQAVTGLGFKPSMVIFFAVGSGNQVSYGVDDGGGINANCIYYLSSTSANIYGGQSIGLYTSVGVEYSGKISSLDSDGFTINWTKSGSPTGTAYIIYLALR